MMSTISQAKTDNEADHGEKDGGNGFAQNAERRDLGALGRVSDNAEERTHKHGKKELFHSRPCPMEPCPCIFPFFHGRGRMLITTINHWGQKIKQTLSSLLGISVLNLEVESSIVASFSISIPEAATISCKESRVAF